ncbi:hypothetical protein [Terrarubrum flagellatum]|uniref:hypothetical protein n=1 Tax=Terrirubrum flagellatum TaxID=2895980 RepID=UPI0031451E10
MSDVFDAIFGVDNYDPCEALRALRPVYMRLVAGAAEETVKFRDRELTYQRADLKSFAALISQLESECASASGLRPKRMAITVGGMVRPRGPFNGPFGRC